MKNFIFVIALIGFYFSPANAQSCPSNAPLFCSAATWDGCCPYGDGGRSDVCCVNNPSERGCTRNGICSDPPPANNGGGSNFDGQSYCEQMPTSAVPDGCYSVEVCADSSGAYYVTDDNRVFDCGSTNCEGAAYALVDYCESRKTGCSAGNHIPMTGVILGFILFFGRSRKKN